MSKVQHMGLFGKRSATPQTATDLDNRDEGWKVATASLDGESMVVRVRTGLDGTHSCKDWPIRVAIAAPLRNQAGRRLLAPDDDPALAYIENLICRTVADRAILVLVITTSAVREFVLYAQSADWLDDYRTELQSAVPGHELQVHSHRDPDWIVYNTFST